MGFLRKTIIVGTGGLAPIKAQSYKERTARATERLVAGRPTRPAPAREPARRLGKQEGWLNEVAAAVRPLKLIECARNTGAQLHGIPLEANAVFKGTTWFGYSNVRVIVHLFATAEEAHQAEVGFLTARASQKPCRAATKTVGRVLYCADNGERRVYASRLEPIVSAVGEIAVPQPAPKIAAAAPASRVAASPSVGVAIVDEIERLAKLHTSGALTDDEFAAAKAKTLGG